VREKNVREVFRTAKKFCATMPHCQLSKNLIQHDNRAGYDRRNPQYTYCATSKSSISESVKQDFSQAPSASRRDAAADIHNLCQFQA
jgi:hypothetical protein